MSKQTRIGAWISALRLRTLPLSVSGIIIGSFVSLYDGFWNVGIVILALMTTISYQIVSNLANDLGDTLKGTDNQDRIGPTRAVQSGQISIAQMKRAIQLTVALCILFTAGLLYAAKDNLTTNSIIFYSILALFCVLAALLYTIGKKAYGYYGLGDLMVFIFFGGVSVLGVYPLYGGQLNVHLIYPAITIGLLSTAVLNLNNMRDRQTDERSNKRTMVVILGPTISKFYHFLLISAALVCQILFLLKYNSNALYIACLPASLVLLLHVQKVMKITNPKEFDGELKVVAFSTFALSLVTSIVLVILSN
jgi:1,4-dihydroxy-2-naphthoate octaprenyltransferase